jgi:hypothetical protein
MSRLRWFVGLLGILALTTICLNHLTEQRNAAFASDAPADLLKRIETLEARVVLLEARLSQTPRPYLPPSVPKRWSQREFNGSPVYIVPLGETVPKN